MDSEKYIRNKNREFVKRTKQSLDITTVVLRKHIVYNPIPNLPLKNCISDKIGQISIMDKESFQMYTTQALII